MGADPLSPSEQAAVAERGPSLKDMLRKQEACAPYLEPEGTPRTDETAPPSVRVRLPDMQIVSYLHKADGETYPESQPFFRHPDLPNGGIAFYDFCDMAYVIRPDPVAEGALTLVGGPLLGAGLDLVGDYPNTAPAILGADRLVEVPGREFAQFDLTDAGTVDWLRGGGHLRWPMRLPDAPIVRVGDLFFIPLEADG